MNYLRVTISKVLKLSLMKLVWILLLILLHQVKQHEGRANNATIKSHESCPFTGRDDHSTSFRHYYSAGNCTRDESDRNAPHLICSGGLDKHYARRSRVYNIKQLTIQGWPSSCFPAHYVLQHFPDIINLTVKHSNITKISSEFPPELTHLKLVRLNNLKIKTLDKTVFANLSSLNILDLRNNSLEYLKPEVLSLPSNLSTVYLLNNLWNCSHLDVKWLSRQNSTSAIIAKERITDFMNLTCQGLMFKGKPINVVMNLFTSLREECPKQCHCYLTHLVKNIFWRKNFVPVSTADCRNKNLTEFPKHVPSITTVLLLNGNRISDIRPLAQNPTYKNVADVYLDDNNITSLRPLEGSDWMMKFRVLSMRGNNLSHIPVYAWDNAFKYNMNLAQLFIGDNPWRCDCHFFPRFQELLLKHQKVIFDLPSIRCAKSENEGISKKQIYLLSKSDVCRQPAREMLQPMDVLNVVLSILILAVLIKFAFDYYNYKKFGKLPWLVDKIP